MQIDDMRDLVSSVLSSKGDVAEVRVIEFLGDKHVCADYRACFNFTISDSELRKLDDPRDIAESIAIRRAAALHAARLWIDEQLKK